MTSVKYVLLLPLCAMIACTEPVSAPSEVVIAKSKPADAVLLNDKFTQPADFTNPCNGEQLIGTATYHVFVATNDTKSGNSSYKSSTRIDFDGVGVATGDTYNGSVTDEVNYSLGTGRATQISTQNRMRMNAKGSAPDFTSVITVHVTINANGTPTASHEVTGAECK